MMTTKRFTAKVIVLRKLQAVGQGRTPGLNAFAEGPEIWCSMEPVKGSEKTDSATPSNNPEIAFETFYRTDISAADRLQYKRHASTGKANATLETYEIKEVTPGCPLSRTIRILARRIPS